MLKLKVIILMMTAMFSGTIFAGDRDDVLKVVDMFYKGDHEGSAHFRKLSLHPNGAYRYINSKGEYKEYTFTFKDGNADKSYQEELLSIDIYEKVALVKLRLAFHKKKEVEYKLMTLHKTSKGWLITGISWGMGITIN